MTQPFAFLQLPLELQMEVLSHYFDEYDMKARILRSPFGLEYPPWLEWQAERQRNIIVKVLPKLKDSAFKVFRGRFRGRLKIDITLPLDEFKFGDLLNNRWLDSVPLERLRIIEFRPDSGGTCYGQGIQGLFFQLGWQKLVESFYHPSLAALETVRWRYEDQTETMLNGVNHCIPGTEKLFLNSRYDAHFVRCMRQWIEFHQPTRDKNESWSTMRRCDGRSIEMEVTISQPADCDECAESPFDHVDLMIVFAVQTPDNIQVKEKKWLSKACNGPPRAQLRPRPA